MRSVCAVPGEDEGLGGAVGLVDGLKASCAVAMAAPKNSDAATIKNGFMEVLGKWIFQNGMGMAPRLDEAGLMQGFCTKAVPQLGEVVSAPRKDAARRRADHRREA